MFECSVYWFLVWSINELLGNSVCFSVFELLKKLLGMRFSLSTDLILSREDPLHGSIDEYSNTRVDAKIKHN